MCRAELAMRLMYNCSTLLMYRSCVDEMLQLWRTEQTEGRSVDVSSWMFKYVDAIIWSIVPRLDANVQL